MPEIVRHITSPNFYEGRFQPRESRGTQIPSLPPGKRVKGGSLGNLAGRGSQDDECAAAASFLDVGGRLYRIGGLHGERGGNLGHKRRSDTSITAKIDPYNPDQKSGRRSIAFRRRSVGRLSGKYGQFRGF